MVNSKAKKLKARSRGKDGALLPVADASGARARSVQDRIVAHLADLGGEGSTSEAERSIVRRASVLEQELSGWSCASPRLAALMRKASMSTSARPATCAACWKASGCNVAKRTSHPASGFATSPTSGLGGVARACRNGQRTRLCRYA